MYMRNHLIAIADLIPRVTYYINIYLQANTIIILDSRLSEKNYFALIRMLVTLAHPTY